MSLLDALQRSGAVRAVDLALAHSLQRLDPGAAPPVLAAAALASYAVAQGHPAFDPAQCAQLVDAPIDWPEPSAWRDALASAAWVAQPAREEASADDCPLVLEDGRVYLRRYREYERRLAAALRRLGAMRDTPVDAPVDALHARLFPARESGDLQADAAHAALLHRLLLVTGGPGTGKTTTVARVLVLLAAQARHAGRPVPRIALAAPTGRAAERMAGSVRRVADDLRTAGIDADLCEALPRDATTLHRLLGLVPGRAGARSDARTPLALDVLVVDEASMVDLPLMCKLAEALPADARLILLGDRDQLPSVEAGDVLAALADAAALAPSATAPLAGCRVHLLRGYRQAGALSLEPVADAVRRGDADAALAALRAGAGGVHWHEDASDVLPFGDALLAPWRALRDVADARVALELAHRARVLTALRDGPQGASTLNARIEQALAGAHREPYFHGRLLLVTRNDARRGLSNGDVGVCLRGADGMTLAWFDGPEGPRAVHPAALPDHASAFAMTVHKAQGSEFDTVWLQLPLADTRVLSRELLYTALTRARRELHVLGPADGVRAALARHAHRMSGLGARLGVP